MFPLPQTQPQQQQLQTDAESSYRVLIDKGDFSQQPLTAMQRANRTKSLLSGGFGRPSAPAPSPYGQPQQQPMMGLPQQSMQPPSMFPVNQGMMSLPPPAPMGMLPQQPSMFGPPRAPNFFQPSTNPGGFGGFGNAGYGGGAGGGNSGFPFSWNPYPRRASPSRRPSSRSRHRHRRHNKKKWYEMSRSRSRSRQATGWWNTSVSRQSRRRSRSSSRSRSHSRSSSRSSRSSSRSSRVSCSTCTGGVHRRSHRGDLSTLHRKIILNTIRDYMPEKNLHDAVYQDIISQMEHMEKNGYRLPKEYDKHKHDISDNEIRLYEQQMQRDKTRDFKKVSNMISFSATCLSQFCEFMQVDWIKTKQLPKVIREAIKEGEFEECMEGIGSYMRGSVFDHPIFSTVLKFVEKVGEAHNNEMEEEQEKLEEEEERRERRHADSLRQLNKLRQDPSAPIDGVPPPPSRRPAAGSRSSAGSASTAGRTTATSGSEPEEPSKKSTTSSVASTVPSSSSADSGPRQQKKMK